MTRIIVSESPIIARVREVVKVDTPLQGPPGTVAAYTHVQSSPATTWIINHNLGYKPDVTLYSSGGVVMYAEIVHASNNQTQIIFTIPTTGVARLI
jgi:hypothetical protein